jgi:hypothetical protein
MFSATFWCFASSLRYDFPPLSHAIVSDRAQNPKTVEITPIATYSSKKIETFFLDRGLS